MTRELADERIARQQLYGRRSGTVDIVPPAVYVESNHAITTCVNGHTVRTVQRDGRGPAFFQRHCPTCGGCLPDVYGACCGDPLDCKEKCGRA